MSKKSYEMILLILIISMIFSSLGMIVTYPLNTIISNSIESITPSEPEIPPESMPEPEPEPIISNIIAVDDYNNILESHSLNLTNSTNSKKEDIDSFLSSMSIDGYMFAGFKNENGEYITTIDYEKNIYPYYIKIDSGYMPIINITTENHAPILNKEDYVSSSIEILNAPSGMNFSENDAKSAGIRLRGNSTLQNPKKPYRIKFDKKTSLLGLNNGQKFKSWVLLAEYYDPSFSRNYIEFYLGHRLGLPYTSDYTFVELYLNNLYEGVYLLCEQQQIDSSRIAIEEYEEGVTDELNTGYLLENDYFYYQTETDPVIEVSQNGEVYDCTHWIVKGDTTKESQINYITSQLQNMYDAIFVSQDESTIKSMVDIDSAVRFNILQLINQDGDSNSSFYLAKDKDGKFTFTAPWDSDMAYGAISPELFISEFESINHLFIGLMHMDWYKELLIETFNSLNINTIKADVLTELNHISNIYSREFLRNFNRYNTLGQKTIDTQHDKYLTFTSQKDASIQLQYFISNRIDRVSSYINSLTTK